jgi:hypothetical protein
MGPRRAGDPASHGSCRSLRLTSRSLSLSKGSTSREPDTLRQAQGPDGGADKDRQDRSTRSGTGWGARTQTGKTLRQAQGAHGAGERSGDAGGPELQVASTVGAGAAGETISAGCAPGAFVGTDEGEVGRAGRAAAPFACVAHLEGHAPTLAPAVRRGRRHRATHRRSPAECRRSATRRQWRATRR